MTLSNKINNIKAKKVKTKLVNSEKVAEIKFFAHNKSQREKSILERLKEEN